MPRIIIATYGSTLNGLASTITSIISYIALLEGGVCVSSAVYLYKPLLEKDQQKVNSIFTSIGKYYSKIGIVFSSITLVLSLLIAVFYRDSVDFATSALLVLILSISNLFTFFFSGKYNAILIADEKSYIKNYLVMGGRVFGTIIEYILIVLGLPFILSQFALNAAIVLSAIPLLLYVKRFYGGLKYTDSTFTLDNKNKNNALLIQVCNVVKKGAPSIIISLMMGLEFASIFSIYSLLFHTGNSFLETLSQSVTSIYGKRIAENDKKRVFVMYDFTELATQCFVSFLFIGFFSVTLQFISIYIVNPDVNYIYLSLLSVFVLAEWFNGSSFTNFTLMMASGEFSRIKKAYLIDAICTIVLGILFGLVAKLLFYSEIISNYGDTMAFILCGYLLGSIMRFFFLQRDCNNVVLEKSSLKPFLKSILSLIIVILICVLIYFINWKDSSGYLELLWHGLVIVIPASLISFLLIALLRLSTTRDMLFKAFGHNKK